MRYFSTTALFILLFVGIVFTQTGTVISEKANLRGTPNGSGKIVAELERATKIEVVKQQGAWFLVQSPEYVGWLHGNTIRINETAFTTLGGSTITEAEAYVPVETPRPLRTRQPLISETPTQMRSGYIRGPRGGCYYLNSRGNKTYVSRSLCN